MKSDLIKNSIYSSVSTLICMIIPLIFYPYITRVLGPTYYGKISFQQTLITYFVILATLGINNYAQKICAFDGNDKKKLSKSVIEVLTIATVLTVVSITIYCITVLVININTEDYPLYFISIGLIMFSSLGMDWLLVTKEKFLFTSVRNVLSRLILLIGCFILIKESKDYIILGFLYAFAYAIFPAVLNYVYIGKYHIIERIKFKDISIKEHLQPIIFLSFVTIGSKIFSSVDIVMIKFYLNETAVGIYNNAIKLPLVLDELLMAIAAVVTPRMYAAVNKNDEKEIYFLVNYASNTMFFFAVPATVTCIFFSTELVEILGGREYVSGGNILVVYSLIMLTTLCLTIVGTRMFIAKNMEKELFLFLIAAGFVNIMLNTVLIPMLGSLGAAVASVTSNFALLIAEISYAHTSKYLIDKDKLKYVCAGFILSIVFLFVQYIYIYKTIFRLCLSIIIGGLFYVSTLFILKESTVIRIILTIKGKIKKIN